MSLADRTPPTPEEFPAFRDRLSNWGRWGDDDQFGTLNFITPDVRRAAAALVSEGRSVSCANPLAVTPGPRNPNPAQHYMTIRDDGCSDYIGVSYHGVVNTHIDALCHIFTGEEGQLYNGRPVSAVTSQGAMTNSIDHWRDGILTRGVLYDIPRLRNVDYVTFDEPVYGWDLKEAAQAQAVTPRPGDAVLIRSGAGPYWSANPPGPNDSPTRRPGVHVTALEYLHQHDAALLGWDQLDASDQGYPRRNPVHLVAIPYMGLPLLDNCNLERLAETCAELGRWDFMLVIAPLVVERGTGSPANPIATF